MTNLFHNSACCNYILVPDQLQCVVIMWCHQVESVKRVTYRNQCSCVFSTVTFPWGVSAPPFKTSTVHLVAALSFICLGSDESLCTQTPLNKCFWPCFAHQPNRGKFRRCFPLQTVPKHTQTNTHLLFRGTFPFRFQPQDDKHITQLDRNVYS